MWHRNLSLSLAAAWLAVAPVQAGSRPPIVVTDASGDRYRAAVQAFADANVERSQKLRQELVDALVFSGLFDAIDPQAFLEPVATVALDGAPTVCPNWRQIGADALVEGELHANGQVLAIEYRVIDVARGCQALLRKRYEAKAGEERRVARVIADDVVEAFTGSRGVANTEIVFVSTRSGTKEIYVMDADGGNVRRATNNRSINTFPNWAPDGNQIVYTSYREGQRPGLFLLTRGGSSPGRILRALGGGAQQYRAVFDPEGEHLAVVMSVNGAADILVVDRDGGNVRSLTRDRAIDIAPTWSPDGKRLAFVSDRTGAPQIYVTDAKGTGVRRLTYDGDYNTAPQWSPDGRWIAYETRIGGQFDIWLIDPEGTVNVPLLDHPRSDENPSWSPDGRLIAFSSNRRGRNDIYVVDVTGQHVRRLTSDAGDNTSPDWGPYRR
jgi:TolB protein